MLEEIHVRGTQQCLVCETCCARLALSLWHDTTCPRVWLLLLLLLPILLWHRLLLVILLLLLLLLILLWHRLLLPILLWHWLLLVLLWHWLLLKLVWHWLLRLVVVEAGLLLVWWGRRPCTSNSRRAQAVGSAEQRTAA